MALTRILVLAVLTNSCTGSGPVISHDQPTKAGQHPAVNSSDVTFNDSHFKNNNSLSSLLNAAWHIRRSLFLKQGSSEIHWSQPQDNDSRIRSRTRRSSNFDHSLPIAENTQLSKRIQGHHKRIIRATSKFTGLVVGASRDSKLLQTVTTTLNKVESLIWSLQSQYSKPFNTAKREPAMILGSFSSDLRTNFHGFKSEWNLRRSPDYSLQDVNSLTTLLVLQCLVEASLYGSATAPTASNMSIAVESLTNFYTRTYSRGSSIVTLWPEKLSTDTHIWVSRSENIAGGQVKDDTPFKQLQQLAKSCACEPAQSGLREISGNKLCADHFSRPLPELFADTANPPDFLTSFSNLALGSLLQFTFPGKKSGMYKTVSQLWLSANNDVKVLINKLKSTAIIFPVKVQEASVSSSANSSNNNTKSNGKTVTQAPTRRARSVNTTSDNSTAHSEEGNSSSTLTGEKHDDDNMIPANTTESQVLVSLDLKANRSSDSTIASGSTDSTIADESTDSTIPAESIESADKVPTNITASDKPPPRENPPTKGPESNSTSPPDPDSNTTVASTQPSLATTTPSPVTATLTTEPPPATTTPSPVTATLTTEPPPASTTPSPVTATLTTEPPPATTTPSPVTATLTTAPPPESTTQKTNASVKVEAAVHVNQILSSESFYGIRKYMDAVLPQAKENVILIPSLITDDEYIDDKKKVVAKNDGNIWHNGKQFHSYNNVNLLTTASTLHAIIVSSMAGIVKLQDDALLQNIVVSSLRLLTWFLSNPQEVVTMVTLSTFPSRYQLYWATARVAFQLNSRQAQSSRMFQFADGAIHSFVKVLRENMTFSILQSIIDGGLGQDGKTRVYIDDFLGVADVDDKGHKLVGGDDRVFSSAMAINTLISTWTVQGESGHLEFDKDVGDPVRIAINSLVNYIHGAVTDPAISNLNAFMSEQPKNCQTSPARYPANIITSPDGTELNPSQPELQHRYGVKGYISKEDYQKLLTKSTFGYTTRGGGLEDLNSPTSIFRFWSSEAYTKAVALLAISQAANLEINTVS